MRPVLRLPIAAFAICALSLALAGAAIAEGNTLYVQTSGNDTAPCTKTAPCRTLTHAVLVAASGDTILLGTGTFAEGTGIGLYKDLTIKGVLWLGTRVTLGWIDPNQTFVPVFFIAPGVTVTLKNMTITGGTSGGVVNEGTLTGENLVVWKNTGQGGILNADAAFLTITNVAIEGNKGPAGLVNYGEATINDSHIDGSSHQGTFPGDGVQNGGTVAIDRGLIAGNEGRGLYAFQSVGCPTTTLTNVTIANNSDGGVRSICGSTTMTHVTISGNKLASPGNGAGIWVFGLTSVALRNSIVAKNGGGAQCYGNVSAAASLVGDNSCVGFPRPDNLVGVDPKLGGLSYQGGDLVTRLFRIGASRVLPLLIGSPAIDAAAALYCIPYDQLAQPRPIDGNGDFLAKCDMGAFEYRPPGPGGTDR